MSLTSYEDLEETGVAYLRLRNAAQRADRIISDVAADLDCLFQRAELLQAQLALREALE